jgi:hypothetical protein
MNRFENAAIKLYNAFNKGELNANECTTCAVGNLCNNETYWVPRSPKYNAAKVKEVTGYNLLETQNIEDLFMFGTKTNVATSLWNSARMTKENQYDGLMLVLEYLAELDGIEIPEVTVENFKKVLTTA